MEEQWVVDRSNLRAVWLEHPEWSKQQLAEALGHSKFWVKKWLKRIRNAPPEDREVLQAHSRARRHPPPQTAPEVVCIVYPHRHPGLFTYIAPHRHRWGYSWG